MTALHRCPSLTLTLLLVLRIVGCIANGCGINKQFGTLKSH